MICLRNQIAVTLLLSLLQTQPMEKNTKKLTKSTQGFNWKKIYNNLPQNTSPQIIKNLIETAINKKNTALFKPSKEKIEQKREKTILSLLILATPKQKEILDLSQISARKGLYYITSQLNYIGRVNKKSIPEVLLEWAKRNGHQKAMYQLIKKYPYLSDATQ